MIDQNKKKISNYDILISFFLLGLTSFGGPIAHIGYFRNVFVKQKKWIDEQTYMDFVSLCNFLPGPSSSQVGMSIGYSLRGVSGALMAWLGFTGPSAIILIFFGYVILNYQDSISNGLLQGLKAIVVAIVLQAIWGMKKNALKDFYAYGFTFLTAVTMIFYPSSANQFLCLICSALFGSFLYKEKGKQMILKISNVKFFNYIPLVLFFSLLILFPFFSKIFDSNLIIKLADIFYRIGSLVFGGGHVVLPLLQVELVSSGLIDEDTFLAGYGAAQAIPGPLFTFSAYLGTFIQSGLSSWLTGIFCLFFIFLPSFLLVIGTLPIWEELRKISLVKGCLKAVNASVIGLLIAALYDPIILSSIKSETDIILIFLSLLILFFTKIPQWLGVLILAFSGWGLSLL